MIQMKNFRLLVGIVVCFVGFTTEIQAQTKWIAHKSHSGDLAEINYNNKGNFGLAEPFFAVDTVVKISNTCLVEIKTEHFSRNRNNGVLRDTICDHPMLSETDPTKLQNYYPRRTVMIGFEKPVKQNFNWILPLILLVSGGIVFAKKR